MTTKKCIRYLVWLLVLLMAAPPCVFAQAAPAQGQQAAAPAPIFNQEELDQMLAPIALYPDSLLIQVLMASTYPMEVVAADRWLNANKNLRGDQFAAALEQQPWDPSVKSLANFPSVLGMMDQKLEWTQKVGDAFLSQEEQVMATVQKLRAAAQTRGNLVSNSQQRVVTTGTTIVIEPVNPQVVYVPAYNPTVVYGPWWYPAYPPYAYAPVGAVIAGAAISFGVGIALGAAWGYAWGGFNWGGRSVSYNVYQNTFIHNTYINRGVYANRYGGGGHGAWHHDPGHRGGVGYRDPGLAHRYGGPGRGGPGGHGPGGIHGPGPGAHGGVRGPGGPGAHGGIHGAGGPGGAGPKHPGVHGGAGPGKGPGTIGGPGSGHGPKGSGGSGGHAGIGGPKSSTGPRTVSKGPGGGLSHTGGPGGGGPKGTISSGGPKGGGISGGGSHGAGLGAGPKGGGPGFGGAGGGPKAMGGGGGAVKPMGGGGGGAPKAMGGGGGGGHAPAGGGGHGGGHR